MEKLQGTVAAMVGGTDGVGEGIVRAVLREGANVVVPYRSGAASGAGMEQYLEDISIGSLTCLPVDLSEEQSVEKFQLQLLELHGRVDLGVACLGSWYYGYSLHKMPFANWQTIVRNNLNTHFLFVRGVTSIMHEQDQGVYIMVNGGAAELIAPEEGVVAVAATAQLMMSRVLKREARATGVRIHSLMAYHHNNTRGRRNDALEEWLSSREVGEYVTSLYTGEASRTESTIHRL